MEIGWDTSEDAAWSCEESPGAFGWGTMKMGFISKRSVELKA